MEQWIFWGVGILLVIGAVLLLGAPPPVELPYNIVITEIDPTGDDEIVWIKNPGEEPVDLSGWQLYTPPRFEFTFPEGCLLAPGASLKVHSGPGSKIHKPFLKDAPVCRPNGDLLWTPHYVWCDQNGDTAYLYDTEGNLVDRYVYGGGWHVSPFVPCDRAGEGEKPDIELP
jgi:hypothetical protein